MKVRSSDIASISEARAKITEMADDVVKNGHEKVLTKNGNSYVALINAKKNSTTTTSLKKKTT